MSSVYTNLFHKQKIVFSFKVIPCEPFVITVSFWYWTNSSRNLLENKWPLNPYNVTIENSYCDSFLMQNFLKLLYSLSEIAKLHFINKVIFISSKS